MRCVKGPLEDAKRWKRSVREALTEKLKKKYRIKEVTLPLSERNNIMEHRNFTEYVAVLHMLSERYKWWSSRGDIMEKAVMEVIEKPERLDNPSTLATFRADCVRRCREHLQTRRGEREREREKDLYLTLYYTPVQKAIRSLPQTWKQNYLLGRTSLPLSCKIRIRPPPGGRELLIKRLTVFRDIDVKRAEVFRKSRTDEELQQWLSDYLQRKERGEERVEFRKMTIPRRINEVAVIGARIGHTIPPKVSEAMALKPEYYCSNYIRAYARMGCWRSAERYRRLLWIGSLYGWEGEWEGGEAERKQKREQALRELCRELGLHKFEDTPQFTPHSILEAKQEAVEVGQVHSAGQICSYLALYERPIRFQILVEDFEELRPFMDIVEGNSICNHDLVLPACRNDTKLVTHTPPRGLTVTAVSLHDLKKRERWAKHSSKEMAFGTEWKGWHDYKYNYYRGNIVTPETLELYY